MTDEDRALITSLQGRVVALEAEVASLLSTRQDVDRLAVVVREVQADLAKLRDLPGAVADLRDRMAKVEAALAAHGVRFDRVDDRLAAIESKQVEHGTLLAKIAGRVGLTGITTPVVVGVLYGVVEILRAAGLLGPR